MNSFRKKDNSPCDIIIVGGGHNGLICSAYLARRGIKVKVLESAHKVGGAAITETFHPGFKNSVAAYTVGLLLPRVVTDLGLKAQGLKIVERPMQNFFPQERSGYLTFGTPQETRQSISTLSREDAKAYPAYEAALSRVAQAIRPLLINRAPTKGGGLGELLKSVIEGNRLRKLPLRTQRDLHALMTRSAADFLSLFFSHEAVLGALAFDCTIGTFTSPFQPGSAYVLLHHAFGEVNGKKGHWGHPIGGMGSISQALERTARQYGVEIETGARVEELLVSTSGVEGVLLEDGRHFKAPLVAASINPKQLFLEMVPEKALPDHFRQHMKIWRCESASLRMNVALGELPDFTCLPGRNGGRHHGSGIVIAPDLDYLHRAYRDAELTGFSRDPIIEIVIPSTLDATLAPTGQHVASLFCQHFRYHPPDGSHWDQRRDEMADRVVACVNHYAPNFGSSILGRQVLTPLDLERKFGLTGGDIFHGALQLDQLWSARPSVGYANHRTPVKGLYLCGSGVHPGGGVTGIPGYNAAKTILEDYKRREGQKRKSGGI